MNRLLSFFFFFFTPPATTEIYTLSLHDALPIFDRPQHAPVIVLERGVHAVDHQVARRSEEHTSELQSRGHLVCRLLLEKKKQICRYVLAQTSTCRMTVTAPETSSHTAAYPHYQM